MTMVFLKFKEILVSENLSNFNLYIKKIKIDEVFEYIPAMNTCEDKTCYFWAEITRRVLHPFKPGERVVGFCKNRGAGGESSSSKTLEQQQSKLSRTGNKKAFH